MAQNKKLLVIIGMPGAGKDTQIAQLQTRQQIEVLRVGDLVRARAKTDPKLAAVLEAGDLVDDEVVNELVIDAMHNIGEQLLVSDGFPRDIAQAEWLNTTLPAQNFSLVGAVYLHISDSEALKRLLKRGRTDDDKATVQHRIDVFHAQTDPVIKYFEQQEKLIRINGEQSVEAVTSEVQEALGW